MKTTIQGLLLSVIAALAFLCGQQMMAAEISDKQQYDVSINAGNYTVHSIATEITKQIGVAFSYGNKLSTTKIRVPDVDMHDATLDAILNAVFKQAWVNWVIKENMVALYVEEEEQPLAAKQSLSSTNSVSGTVMDAQQQPLVGVVVYVSKDAKRASVSDLDGRFSLQANSGEELVFSLVGYEEETYNVAGPVSGLKVILNEDIQQIDETVIVAYGSQKKVNLTGAVSQIGNKELKIAPSGNVSSLLSGKLPGLVSKQSSGQPGADGSSLYVRGIGAGDGQVLVVVDGVVRSFPDISPDEIESITILKDATSAAAYGVRASGGVMLITTKRGVEQKPTITLSSSVTLASNANFPEFLDGPGYAYWYNKAEEMDGVSLEARRFTPEEIDRITNGDPEGVYANTDWLGLLFKKAAPTYTNNISLSGGSADFKYFASIGAYNQQGSIANTSYDRYNVRMNINGNITKNLSMTLGIAGRISEQIEPGLTAGKGNAWASVFQQALLMYPYLPETHDGLPVGSLNSANGNQNPLAARDLSGKQSFNSTVIETNATLRWEVPWIPGLQFRVLGSFDKSFSTKKIESRAYQLSVWNQTTKSWTTEWARHSSAGVSAVNQWQNEVMEYTLQPSVEYENTFGVHHIKGMFLYEYSRTEGKSLSAGKEGYTITDIMDISYGSSILPALVAGGHSTDRRAGYVTRFNYDYDERYLAEVTVRIDGTPYLPSSSRWGVFPGVSFGWRISEEPWLKENTPWLDNLKIRTSAGRLGSDRSLGYSYSYLSTMALGTTPSVYFGTTPGYALIPSAPVNPNLRWQTNDTYNVGLEGKLWRGLLGFELDMFYMYCQRKIESQANSYPPSSGGYYPSVINNGIHNNKGFELLITHENNIGGFNYSIRGNVSWARNKILRISEDPNLPEYAKKVGHSIGQYYGLLSQGLFQTQEEINASPTYGSKVNTLPGDVKLVDINRDNQITWGQDLTAIGRSSTPEMMFGLNINAFWKGFDLNVFFQGAALCNVPLCGCYTDKDGIYDDTFYTRPFAFDGNTPRYLVENAWTPENPNAKYPRLGIVNRSNGGKMSDFWVVDGSYLRLKALQIGYSLPSRVLKKANINSVRFFVSSGNVFTLSALPYLDPEMPDVNQGYYPQQRTFEFGINVNI